ncbi:hypothetical protein [Nocardia alba]|uniref:Uncharacterized protein n=1 Tax=Nocardia alba TaxID=225051 RepID=A0A4R1FZT1_9NOCA|nr:hypothetical protein [Nocardia alba]TCJ99780.1 hypothetical protein DFR71_0763 [Nocardia alba]
MSIPEPIHDLARGDIGVSRQLSRALRVLMDTATDPQLKNQLRGILAGTGSARDLMHSEGFNQVLDRTMPDAMRHFAEMSDEERQRLAEQGEADLARLRIAPPADESHPSTSTSSPSMPSTPADRVVPGTRKPNRERIVTPDEDDEDDAYFRERQQRGWLR